MANITYQEQLTAKRMEKIRDLLRSLPSSCSDFINSITMTTSTLTRMAYTIDLKTFCDYATRELPYFRNKTPLIWTDADIAHFTALDLNGYANYLTLYVKEGTTEQDQRIIRNHECGVMRKIASLRSYFDYLFKMGRISGNVASMVDLPKLHDKPILHLISDEVEKLLNVVEDGIALTDRQQAYHKLTRTRDAALLMLFLGTGIRISECVGIDISDVDFASNAVLITRKGGNQSIVYFPQEVANALQTYLEERQKLKTDKINETALFLSLQKRRISQRAVQIMVKKYCSLAVPLKKHMSPHKLRSTYATRLYHETEDIYLVAEALGHSDINTTRKHYAAMSDERRREAAANVHLPNVEHSTKQTLSAAGLSSMADQSLTPPPQLPKHRTRMERRNTNETIPTSNSISDMPDENAEHSITSDTQSSFHRGRIDRRRYHKPI